MIKESSGVKLLQKCYIRLRSCQYNKCIICLVHWPLTLWAENCLNPKLFCVPETCWETLPLWRAAFTWIFLKILSKLPLHVSWIFNHSVIRNIKGKSKAILIFIHWVMVCLEHETNIVEQSSNVVKVKGFQLPEHAENVVIMPSFQITGL